MDKKFSSKEQQLRKVGHCSYFSFMRCDSNAVSLDPRDYPLDSEEDSECLSEDEDDLF